MKWAFWLCYRNYNRFNSCRNVDKSWTWMVERHYCNGGLGNYRLTAVCNHAKKHKGKKIYFRRTYHNYAKRKSNKEKLKKAKLDIDDLIASARVSGYFNLTDIDSAIMEITGSISFMPTPQKGLSTQKILILHL